MIIIIKGGLYEKDRVHIDSDFSRGDASACGGTGVQLGGLGAFGSNPAKDRVLGKETLRERLAGIGSVKYLYASHPVEILNFGTNQTAIETDDYWYGFVNKAIIEVCTTSGGKATAKNIITDSFSGARTTVEADAQSRTLSWKCEGGDIDFVTATIKAKHFNPLNKPTRSGYRYLIVIKSDKSGAPVLSDMQYNMIKHFEASGKSGLKAYLDSKVSILGDRAFGKVQILPDGAWYQRYGYDGSNVVNIEKDLGALYYLHAYCASNGGNIESTSGYLVPEIQDNIFPVHATFNCTSQTEPFTAKISHITGFNKYELFIKHVQQ